MREEEKKAVEHLNSFLNIPEFVWIKESELLMINVKIVLNLIENQQKELNNLKEIEKSHKEENGKLRVYLTKQEKTIENAKDRIEYYLMGNSTLNDFNVREKELEKLLNILKKAEESE